jgi:D-glycero-D-manno-heptose 1,7-bisphosphate phosphatase
MGIDGRVSCRAVFLDRDGVINRNLLNLQTNQFESPLTPEDFHLTDGALTALLKLQNAGYLLFLVSNQPNYALGKASLEVLGAIHDRMKEIFDQAGISFAKFYYCFHHPRGIMPEYSGRCECRKPSPHFLLQAQRNFGLDLDRSWMIGDRETDMQCGQAAGAKTIQVFAESTVPIAGADRIASNLTAAVSFILNGEEEMAAEQETNGAAIVQAGSITRDSMRYCAARASW